MTSRVALLAGPATYRGDAFLNAARRLRLEVLRVVDTPAALTSEQPSPGWLPLDFAAPDAAIAGLRAAHEAAPLAAVIALDDSATMLAASAAAAVGLPHNDPSAALAARNKWTMRGALLLGDVPVPEFRLVPLSEDPGPKASWVGYPVVVKPTTLSGSRGVIRADNEAELREAFARAGAIARESAQGPDAEALLIERYLPGVEVALEGLLTGGELRTLALFDKPDPLEGPYFEETIYVTPSRLEPNVQAAISARTAEAAAALGLREGPVHAELRVNDDGVWLIEMAGRSIGGLCSTVLEFGAGISLEELILRHAVGLPLPDTGMTGAAGVMMIPIPRGGILRGVTGVEAASAVPGVTGVEITAPLHQPLVPLPEGSSYLGFIFARGDSPAEVEDAIRSAHACLTFQIGPAIPLRVM
ncbi:MAG: ATP-grasp domain-containing protein [Thermomicrobiales bacterium]